MGIHIPRDLRRLGATMGLGLAGSSTTQQLRSASNWGRALSQPGKTTWSRMYVHLRIVLLHKLTLLSAYSLWLFNRSLETLFQRLQFIRLAQTVAGSVPMETQAMVSTAVPARGLLERTKRPTTAVCFDLPPSSRRPELT
jgi:hypothetical protein